MTDNRWKTREPGRIGAFNIPGVTGPADGDDRTWGKKHVTCPPERQCHSPDSTDVM